MLLDAGEAWRQFIVSRQPVKDIVATRVGITLQGTEPAIRYAVVGGSVGYPDEGDPRLQVECWGRSNVPDDGTASRLARTVVDEAQHMHGSYAGGWVAGCTVEGHPFQSNDPTTNRPRWIVHVVLAAYGG